ncbi:hypothetical protein C8A00DRAFT_17931 [Chaetomidium leptoderma]|uniref:Uncharacterized protein n=1 Tax=Chaetomidium leptoderma TaxID=669021 RepID=A0AAN6VFK0_9PEZI|nr:hypothetical protein C8A00DRAFT_17931 [Chaetomidium leptoderma]
MSNNADQEPPCGAVDALSCPNPQCKRREGMLKAEIDRLTEELEPVRVLQKEIAALEARLGGHGKRTKRTWPALLRRHLADPGFGISYARIHQICCMEENMSTKNWFVHPDIKLVAPDDQDRDSEADFDVGHDLALEAAPASDGPQTRRDEKSFPFDKLPWQLQGTILKLILHKRGRIIHCISRLDPFIPPASFPSAEELGEHRSGLKKVFFWGKSECSISSGVDPKDHLAILTVSKRFYFLGVHIFYGLNTFGFSSLGEFGRFAQGTGLPRIARIQHMELLLTGSQRLTAPLDTRGKVPMSRRTYPLSWLVDMYRLKTLVVHINETGWFHTRRKYENPTVKRLLEAKTRGQPNRRMSRSLRCVQGIDYVYQLRGMEWIRFYDVNQAFHGRRNVRHPVQDWSFSEDITNTTTLPKPPTRQQNAELENLEPLFTGENPWTPSADDWKLVKSVFIDTNGRCSYDDLRLRKSNRDADLASYLSVAGTAQVVDISSDSESDTESSDPTSEPSSDPGSDSEGPDSDSDSALGTIFEDDDTSDSDSESSSSSESESESSSESSDDDGAGGGGDDEDDSESDDDDSDSALEDLLAGVSLAEGRDLVSDLSSSDDDDEDESADSDSDDEVVNSSGGGSGKSLKRPLGGGWQKGSPGGKRPRVEV